MTGAVDRDVVIDVRGLNKHFGDNHAVKDLALKVHRGEIFGFLGPNGSGKTTSIRMLCGLLTPDSGEGTCLGHDILRETKAIKREVGYMTQRFSFWEDLTIRENLRFVARMYGMADRTRRVDEAISELGLSSRASQLAHCSVAATGASCICATAGSTSSLAGSAAAGPRSESRRPARWATVSNALSTKAARPIENITVSMYSTGWWAK